MIELFFFPSPNGMKIAIMLEECGLPYKLTRVDITSGEQFEEAFVRISPNCKIPALIDHSVEPPITLFESGAMLLYLAKKSSQFFPADDTEYYQALPWLFWQVGHLGPMAGQAHYFREQSEIKDTHASERFTREMHRLYSVMDTRLQQTEFMCGDYSIVDMACWPWVKYHRWQGQALADFAGINRWFASVANRPAVQKAEQHGSAEIVDRESYRNVLHNQTGDTLKQFQSGENGDE